MTMIWVVTYLAHHVQIERMSEERVARMQRDAKRRGYALELAVQADFGAVVIISEAELQPYAKAHIWAELQAVAG